MSRSLCADNGCSPRKQAAGARVAGAAWLRQMARPAERCDHRISAVGR
jgi:hypothetical protein